MFGRVGLCVHVYIYICQQKNRLFSALPLENLLLSVMRCLLFKFKRLQCGLLHPASCTDRAIYAFPNKTWTSPWPRNIFGSGYFYGTVNDTRLAILDLTAIARCHGYHVIFRQSALSWGAVPPQTPCCWIVDQSFLKP